VKKRILILISLLLAALLAACGGREETVPAPTALPSAAAPSETPRPLEATAAPTEVPPAESPAAEAPHPIQIYGREFFSDAAEIDLSDVPVEDQAAELEARLPAFSALEKVVMCDCGLSDEQMDALDQKYENVRFVWTVHFGGYSLRTDAAAFIAAKEPHGELSNKDMPPLRYCTDLVALDLGHMKFTDISFVSGMKHLRFLVLADGEVDDIGPVAELPELEYLEIFRTKVRDLTPLLKCKSLKDLNICYLPQSASRDIYEVLLQTTWLERLFYAGNKLTREEKNTLMDAYPETAQVVLYEEMESTGLDWRYHPRYYEMRDLLGMYYMPGGTKADG